MRLWQHNDLYVVKVNSGPCGTEVVLDWESDIILILWLTLLSVRPGSNHSSLGFYEMEVKMIILRPWFGVKLGGCA